VEVMGWVNDFIKPTGYVAGTDHLTVADLCFVATYATIEACGKFDLTPYAETNAWFEKMKTEIPNYEKANGEGATAFGGWFKSKNA
jgi:glutathione S-transferase